MKDYREALLQFDDQEFLLEPPGASNEPPPKVNLQQKVKLGLYQLQRLFA